jgi:CrcB protein
MITVKLLIQSLLVTSGSAIGGLARWGISLAAAKWLGTAFPWGTLIINLTGCLLLGWFSTFIGERVVADKVPWLHADDWRLMVAVGFAGAYTTFSTFELEADGLLRRGDGLAAVTYLFGSVFVGLLAVRAGILLAHWK